MIQDEGIAAVRCYVVMVYTIILPNHNSSMLGVEEGEVLDALVSQLVFP